MLNLQLLNAIRVLKHSHKSIATIFTEGACFEFYKFLKHLYPEAEPWYDGSHVYTKIDGYFYDITGGITFTDMGERGLRLMTEDDIAFAEFWGMEQYSVDKLS